jgi:hypothetical protein
LILSWDGHQKVEKIKVTDSLIFKIVD